MKTQLLLNSIIQHFEGTCSRSKRATTHGWCTAKTFAASILKRPISSQKKKKRKKSCKRKSTAMWLDHFSLPGIGIVKNSRNVILSLSAFLLNVVPLLPIAYIYIYINILETARPFTSKVIEKLYFCLQPQLLFLLVPPATTTTTTPVRKWGIRPVSWNYLEQDINII